MAERILTIPLRSEVLKANRTVKTERAVQTVRREVAKHLKIDDVRLSPLLNETLWAHSRERPPGSLRVKVEVKEGRAMVRLPEEMAVVDKGKGAARTDKAAETKNKGGVTGTDAAGGVPEKKGAEPQKQKAVLPAGT